MEKLNSILMNISLMLPSKIKDFDVRFNVVKNELILTAKEENEHIEELNIGTTLKYGGTHFIFTLWPDDPNKIKSETSYVDDPTKIFAAFIIEEVSKL